MTSKEKKIEFIFNLEDNCYSIYTEVETANNSARGFIGYVGLNTNVNRYVFQPSEETHYSEFTLRKIANFISKLNKKLEQNEVLDNDK